MEAAAERPTQCKRKAAEGGERMSALKAQAIEMIEDVPEDSMPKLISFISTLTQRQEVIARKRAAFERLEELRKEHAHLFPADFDPDKALEDAREERCGRRYGSFD